MEKVYFRVVLTQIISCAIECSSDTGQALGGLAFVVELILRFHLREVLPTFSTVTA